MPELPEVETVVRGLQSYLPGLQVEKVAVFDSRPLGELSPEGFILFCQGKVFSEIKRFGKYIHFLFEDGSSLVAHLRMTGKFIFQEEKKQGKKEPHVHLLWNLSGKKQLYYKDVRIFGTIRVYEAGAVIREKGDLGVDPVLKKLTVGYLMEKAQGRKIPVKTFLLDQKVVAGLGNIYASEILFEAGVRPERVVSQVLKSEWEAIVRATDKVLALALKHNGTSISDFRNVDDKSGEFQNMLRVYQRAGLSCRKCKEGRIQKIIQGQRSTFFCPTCQR